MCIRDSVQADALMARNYKRKIRRYSSMLKAHKRGELNLFEAVSYTHLEPAHATSGFPAGNHGGEGDLLR